MVRCRHEVRCCPPKRRGGERHHRRSRARCAEDTGTTLPATLSTIAGYVDTEIAAIKAKTDLIPGDIDGYTYEEVVKLVAAVLLGRASGLNTSEAVYHALDGSKARISAAVDRHGNRGIVTRDAT